ncbi:cubilin-like [Haliotis rubra]|uniref:cubilin-like n=1 Tax=Haliotis rubra TaxID=36100 RepID=UPI001EE59B2F|nr:cubilin-like [Haliotis rubra]
MYHCVTVPATCSTCGHTLWATYSWQTLTYPDNNFNYPSNQACEWNIQSGRSGYIQIQTVYVHIQNSFACSKDYLEIGQILTGYELVCGERALQYESDEKGKDVFLRFVSDGHGSDRGFRVKYRIVDAPSAEYLPATRNYTPVIYPSSQDAISGSFEKSWIMYTQDTKLHVLVKFEESTIICTNAFIKVFDGISTSDLLLGNLCDNRTNTFQSTGEYARVLLHSQTGAPGSISFKFRAVDPPSLPSKCPSHCRVVILQSRLSELTLFTGRSIR